MTMAIGRAYDNKSLKYIGNIGGASSIKAQPMKEMSKAMPTIPSYRKMQPIKPMGQAVPARKIAPRIQTSNVGGKTIVNNAAQQGFKPGYAVSKKRDMFAPAPRSR